MADNDGCLSSIFIFFCVVAAVCFLFFTFGGNGACDAECKHDGHTSGRAGSTHCICSDDVVDPGSTSRLRRELRSDEVEEQ